MAVRRETWAKTKEVSHLARVRPYPVLAIEDTKYSLTRVSSVVSGMAVRDTTAHLQPSIVTAQLHTFFTHMWTSRVLLPVRFVTLVEVPLFVEDRHQHIEVLSLFPATQETD